MRSYEEFDKAKANCSPEPARRRGTTRRGGDFPCKRGQSAMEVASY